ncbi:MAG: type IV pili twitching motility protein PilT [Bdellovibrionales bacterium RBG_16_40_8]|nr:MAG: type IV pili twitching motility protein PilT [Bdellovibrionales bacterium RBG_16_40_8]
MAQIDQLFKIMVAQGASDLHLSAGAPPFLRLHGEMVKIEHPELNNDAIQGLVFEILTEKQRRLFVENWELDCSYAVNGLGRFRCNIFMHRRGMGAVFRVIPEKVKTIQELGLPQTIQKLIEVPRGLVLVTGPTGSGKSTTLASMLHTINMTERQHILTVEDPIEFVHENHNSLFNQREVSNHTKSFANALKAALREDPDTILVGEMRDLETIALAITAAETGHLVFGTLHTSSAAKTVDRIIDAFPQEQQAQIRVMLAESLRGVVSQTLFPRADKPGRVAAIEILVNTFAVANLIREGKTFQIPSVMQTSAGDGMMTFEHHVRQLFSENKITKEAAENFIGKPITKDPNLHSHGRPAAVTQSASMKPIHSPSTPPLKNDPSIKIHSTSDAAKPSGDSSALKSFIFGNKKTGS